MESLKDHTIICGYGRFGQTLARELQAGNHPFVVVDTNSSKLALAEEHGCLVVSGDATEESTLRDAGIDRAHCLASVLPADSLNVFITLTARNLNTDLRILARGEQPSTEPKLRQAGANEVVLPAFIGGVRMAQNIIRPGVMGFLRESGSQVNQDLHRLGLSLEEVRVEAGSSMIGHTLEEVENRSGSSHLVVAVRQDDGTVIKGDRREYKLKAGDTLISVGHDGGDMPQFS